MAEPTPAVAAFARVQRALAFLQMHPAGLPLADLAKELHVEEKQLRKDLIAFYSADIPPEALLGLQRPDSLQFLAPDGQDDDPGAAAFVRIVSSRAEAELGVDYLRADELSSLHRAAQTLSQVEPANDLLRSALATLESQILGVVTSDAESPGDRTDADVLPTLRLAIESQRQVRIRYSRAWEPGTYRRDVDPYGLVRTRRGWELDAGPLSSGQIRTYLVERITSVQLADTTFTRPDELARIVAQDRAETAVELNLPQRTQWVADRFAERTEVLQGDQSDLALRAWFLPPVEERVGLVLAIAGPGAFVIGPPQFAAAGSQLAAKLLEHHDLA
ncbi:MAG: WYL domain-containing protein [Actinomycetia bacterium]|nr:WYL domain-containing protein [Actinomycetes bacterium]